MDFKYKQEQQQHKNVPYYGLLWIVDLMKHGHVRGPPKEIKCKICLQE